MSDSQKINCTVGSCKFNNKKDKECCLEQIVVTPVIGYEAKSADDSMCSSYKKNKKI